MTFSTSSWSCSMRVSTPSRGNFSCNTITAPLNSAYLRVIWKNQGLVRILSRNIGVALWDLTLSQVLYQILCRNVTRAVSGNFFYSLMYFSTVFSIILKPETCNITFKEWRFHAIIGLYHPYFINALLNFYMGYLKYR